MPLIINLDDSCAVPGGSVTVKYGHNQDTASTSDDKFTTTTATLNAAGTTATAYLQKSYAFGDELWFNNTVITVKNASGTEIKITYKSGSADYFMYNAAGHIINITKYSSEAKLLSIAFTNLSGVKAGTVTYGPSDKEEEKATLKTVDMNIAADGASATAPISPDNCQANGWFYIAEVKVYSDTAKTTAIAVDTISYATDGGKPWMGVNDMKAVTLSKDAEEIITFPYTKTVTVASEGYSKIVPANAFKDKTIAYLSVKITSETEGAWASLSGANAWGQATYQSGCINTTTNIDSADFLTAVKANGLYIDSSVGTFTVEVSYSETPAVGNPMKVVLSFAEDIGAKTVTANCWYSNAQEDTSTAKDYTVTENKVTIEVPFTSAWGYNAKITVKDASSAEIKTLKIGGIASTAGDTGTTGAGSESDLSKYWFPFVGNSTLTISYEKAEATTSGGTTETLPYTASEFPFTKSYTGTGSNETFLKKESFANLSSGTVTVAFTWASGSGNPWFGVGDSWPTVTWDGSTASGTTTVAALKANDLVIGAPAGAGFTVTISVAAE